MYFLFHNSINPLILKAQTVPVYWHLLVLFAYFYASKPIFGLIITLHMIQRVQTIWLLLACACAFLTMKFPFYSGHLITDSQNQLTPLAAVDSIPIVTLTVASAIGSLITIFLFKDRKLQMRITIANIVVSLIILCLYFLNMKNNYKEMTLPLITCVFAFAVPVFLILAFSGIYKDHRLVKSVDRLR